MKVIFLGTAIVTVVNFLEMIMNLKFKSDAAANGLPSTTSTCY